MGPNLMSSKDRNPVIETAQRTVAAQLADPSTATLLAELPPGDERRVRRPPGDPSEWPDLDEIRELAQGPGGGLALAVRAGSSEGTACPFARATAAG